MKVQDLESLMVKQVIEHFKLFPVDALKLSDEEAEKAKNFIHDFSMLAENMSDNHELLYDIKTIFTAIMMSVLTGPKALFKLSKVVSDHMMPKREDFDLTKKVLDKLKDENGIVDIRDAIKKILNPIINNEPEDPELTNVLDEHGNRMTISQLEAKNDKN